MSELVGLPAIFLKKSQPLTLKATKEKDKNIISNLFIPLSFNTTCKFNYLGIIQQEKKGLYLQQSIYHRNIEENTRHTFFLCLLCGPQRAGAYTAVQNRRCSEAFRREK